MFSCFQPAKNMDRPDFVGSADSATDLGISPKSGHAEHLSEKIAAVPNLAISANAAFRLTKPADAKAAAAFDFDPTRRFVRELAKRSDYRRRIAEIVRDNTLGGEGGAAHIMAFINDEQHAVPSLPALRAALQHAEQGDLLMYASRYNLFAQYSADKGHPWDALPAAGAPACVLEIGKAAGTQDEVAVLLDGVRVKSFEFTNSVFKTKEPVQWRAPTGQTAPVHLELRFSAFFGYGSDTEAEMGRLRYLGPQANGCVWAADASLADWPIAPPMVSGKVNVAGRDAALAPGAADTLAAFQGVFQTHFLPQTAGHPATPGAEISVSVAGGKPAVALDGVAVDAWTFGPNNVLSFEDAAGRSAMLQFVSLAGGPVVLGSLYSAAEPAPEGFNLFGELKGEFSRLSPTGVVDAEPNEKIAAGLGVAGTFLLTSILAAAADIWAAGKDLADDGAHAAAVGRLSTRIAALLHLEDLAERANRAFLPAGLTKDVDAASAKLAQMAAAAAREKAEAVAQAARVSEKEARDTEEEFKAGNAAMSTYKASQTAWKASQAAEAAAEAETFALEAAQHARNARTAAALDASLAAAQAYNEARLEAHEAAKAERRAATAALRAVEGGIDFYAKAKNFDKLKEIAEASGVATKALCSATEAVEGWEADSVASRQAALLAARASSEHAQECYKHMRRVQPAQQA